MFRLVHREILAIYLFDFMKLCNANYKLILASPSVEGTVSFMGLVFMLTALHHLTTMFNGTCNRSDVVQSNLPLPSSDYSMAT